MIIIWFVVKSFDDNYWWFVVKSEISAVSQPSPRRSEELSSVAAQHPFFSQRWPTYNSYPPAVADSAVSSASLRSLATSSQQSPTGDRDMSPPILPKFEAAAIDGFTADRLSRRCSESPDSPLNLCKTKSKARESTPQLPPLSSTGATSTSRHTKLTTSQSKLSNGNSNFNSSSSSHLTSSHPSKDNTTPRSKHLNNDADSDVKQAQANNFDITGSKMTSPPTATPLTPYYGTGLTLGGRCLVPPMNGVLAAAHMASLPALASYGLGSLEGATSLLDKVSDAWKQLRNYQIIDEMSKYC